MKRLAYRSTCYFILRMAGIAEASARGAGEAGLAAGAQDQGDEQPRLKVTEFQKDSKIFAKE
jgi:hypothetical protein